MARLPREIARIELPSGAIRYRLRMDLGYDSETGNRLQVKKNYRTEQDARDALAEFSREASTGVAVSTSALTVSKLAAEWLAAQHNARPTTLKDYRYSLAPLLDRHGSVPVQKLTRAQLDSLLADLRKGGTKTAKGHVRKPWSARSFNKAVDHWRLMLAYGMDRRALSRNVAAQIKKLPKDKAPNNTYTPDEIRTALSGNATHRNRHILYLALNGLRRGEIAGLRWDDIDFDKGTLSITRNRVQLDSSVVADGASRVASNDPKTRSSIRTLPIDSDLVRVLREVRTNQREEQLRAGTAYEPSGYVAVSELGTAYTPDALTKIWHKLTDNAGVRAIRLHDARHSAGTAMHLRGVPIATIAAWLGHSDASFTMTRYAHSQDDALKAAGGVLAGVVTDRTKSSDQANQA